MKESAESDFIIGNGDKNFCKKEYTADGRIWLHTKNCRIDLISLLCQAFKDWPVLHSREFRKFRRQKQKKNLASKSKKDI